MTKNTCFVIRYSDFHLNEAEFFEKNSEILEIGNLDFFMISEILKPMILE